jgi:hypothetical protein
MNEAIEALFSAPRAPSTARYINSHPANAVSLNTINHMLEPNTITHRAVHSLSRAYIADRIVIEMWGGFGAYGISGGVYR